MTTSPENEFQRGFRMTNGTRRGKAFGGDKKCPPPSVQTGPTGMFIDVRVLNLPTRQAVARGVNAAHHWEEYYVEAKSLRELTSEAMLALGSLEKQEVRSVESLALSRRVLTASRRARKRTEPTTRFPFLTSQKVNSSLRRIPPNTCTMTKCT